MRTPIDKKEERVEEKENRRHVLQRFDAKRAALPCREEFAVTKMWTVRLQGVGEVNHKPVTINGKIYSFDPYRQDCTVRGPVDVYIFDTASYQWELLQTQALPDGRPMRSHFGRTVVAYGESAYLWSALDDVEVGRVVYRFDTRTMTWSRLHVSGQWPELRCGQTACLVGSKVYLHGGWPVYSPSLPQINFLDLETMRWDTVTTNGELPDSPWYHSASAIGDRMYVWGGTTLIPGQGTVYDNSLAFLDTTTLTWVWPHVEGVPPEGREDHSAFFYRGELYVFGGLQFKADRHFNSLHKYSPEKSCWSQVTPKRSGPSARRFASCCVIEDSLFVFGGQGPKPNARHPRVYSGESSSSIENEEMLTDIHVLDFFPALKVMCLMALIDANVHVDDLPPAVKKQIRAMTTKRTTLPSS